MQIQYPTLYNEVQFMMFNNEILLDNYLFEGTLKNFSNCYETVTDWADVVIWAEMNNCRLIIEDTSQYNLLVELLDADSKNEMWYD